jgi:Ino eighty subunit 2
MRDGNLIMRVGVPPGREGWLGMDTSAIAAPGVKGKGICGVHGCGKERIYRSVKSFEIGGCSMAHLKEVDAGLS